ncbi:MAG: hypothetical protein DYG92_04630 [Leptolyngbya sp. PLA1]|nr:hypothetical protein [Leptolyngbya sp. PLA1]
MAGLAVPGPYTDGMNELRRVSVAIIGLAWLGALLAGCAGPQGNALEHMQSRGSAPRSRIDAIPLAKAQAGSSEAAVAGWRTALARLAWDTTEVPSVRAAAIKTIFAEPESEFRSVCRETAMRVLPKESSREVVLALCEVASSQGWTDFGPAIVRSYSRKVPMVPEEKDRAERAALVALFPGQSVEETAFGVFLTGGPIDTTSTDRTRLDAWDLLARLDPSGATHRRLIEGASVDDADIRVLRAGMTDLRAVALSGEQLLWLKRLRGPENAAWWQEVSSVIAGFADPAPLGLRHAEHLRWTAANRPERLTQTREALLAELSGRIAGRQHFERTAEAQNTRPREALSQVGPRLSRADLISILALDDALQAPGLGVHLCEQVRLDRKDQTTEYGGLVRLEANGPRTDAAWALFPPRPGERQGDNRFIASPDMIVRSDTAAAHFHFHGQTWRNHDLAGPSPADLEYAARFGRACLVMTTVGECVLSVDYYQPDGVVVDLGTISGVK